ncbi:MAG: transport system permease protein [Chlorobi bacterium OLB7]|nr:MAG: transport system permease protein [Chlorobi bacterium OLB7]
MPARRPRSATGRDCVWVLVLGASLVGGNILNAISLGDDEAAALGVPVDRARTVLYLLGSLTVGLTVSFCGAIGFVGLVAPHIMRRIVGPDHRMLLPASVVGGGIFLLLCDTAARSLMGFAGNVGSELPVGAVTALVARRFLSPCFATHTAGWGEYAMRGGRDFAAISRNFLRSPRRMLYVAAQELNIRHPLVGVPRRS